MLQIPHKLNNFFPNRGEEEGWEKIAECQLISLVLQARVDLIKFDLGNIVCNPSTSDENVINYLFTLIWETKSSYWSYTRFSHSFICQTRTHPIFSQTFNFLFLWFIMCTRWSRLKYYKKPYNFRTMSYFATFF